MDIECKLKRDGGSIIPLGDVTYHFAPREDGAHVATVEDEAHQERFLSITEAYRLYRGDAPSADAGDDTPADTSEERAALAAEYKARFGKAPASRLSAAKIREALAAQ